MPGAAAEKMELADWRQKTFELYARVRRSSDPEAAWRLWCSERDRMFRSHPQSPIPQRLREGFRGLRYFDYDAAARVTAAVVDVPQEQVQIHGSSEESFGATKFAIAEFDYMGDSRQLELYWLEGYAGGLFLSFSDATSGAGTYPAGRYLLDTAKGSDLGVDGELVIDFNFAYQPSCSYDPRFSCPLSPPANRLPIPVQAGEMYVAEVGG